MDEEFDNYETVESIETRIIETFNADIKTNPVRKLV